jgi:hypothetical protein
MTRGAPIFTIPVISPIPPSSLCCGLPWLERRVARFAPRREGGGGVIAETPKKKGLSMPDGGIGGMD